MAVYSDADEATVATEDVVPSVMMVLAVYSDEATVATEDVAPSVMGRSSWSGLYCCAVKLFLCRASMDSSPVMRNTVDANNPTPDVSEHFAF